MRALLMEFYKTRRRFVWLPAAMLVGVQLCWMLWASGNMKAHDLAQGWLYCLYEFPVLNSVMMPVAAAVTASRLCDAEHKGQTLRLLETVMPAGRLFDAKYLCGAFYMIIAALAQVALIFVAGRISGFSGEPPLILFGWYLLFSVSVNLTLLLFQQILSLLIVNQMLPLAAGIIGSFAGLFSLFFPQGFQRFLLWGYYGVLMFVGLDWDRATRTRITDFYVVAPDWAGFASLLAVSCVLYLIGRTLFVRKEW